MKGDDVTNLQAILLKEGFLTADDVSPKDNKLPTGQAGYFGPKTQAAVQKYQAKYGIEQTGIVGPITRAKLSQ